MQELVAWTKNRVYFVNKDFSETHIEPFLLGNGENDILFCHIFYITDLNFFSDYDMDNILGDEDINDLENLTVYKSIKCLKPYLTNKTRLHFVGIRPHQIGKQYTKAYKDTVRKICKLLYLRKEQYTLMTSTNFMISKSSADFYNILPIPNTLQLRNCRCLYSNPRSNEEYLNIAGVEKESIVDGPGFRYTIFVQGCNHHCIGCQNPETHNYTAGKFETVKNLYNDIITNPLLKGVTFSGGEPFDQAYSLYILANKLKYRTKLDIMIYTGYTLKELQYLANYSRGIRNLLHIADYIVDGRFNINLRTLNAKFRGSSNQKMWKHQIINDEHTWEEIYPCEG